MEPDCKSVIRRFESDLGLSENPVIIGDSARNENPPITPDNPDSPRPTGPESCGGGCGETLPLCYLIRAGKHAFRPIKIGVAVDIPFRMSRLQTGNPERLMLLGTVPGGYAVEDAFHHLLSPFQQTGEWFYTGTSLLSRMATAIRKSRELGPALARLGALDDRSILWLGDALCGSQDRAAFVEYLIDPAHNAAFICNLLDHVAPRWPVAGVRVLPLPQGGGR